MVPSSPTVKKLNYCPMATEQHEMKLVIQFKNRKKMRLKEISKVLGSAFLDTENNMKGLSQPNHSFEPKYKRMLKRRKDKRVTYLYRRNRILTKP